jgi:hypothetical protein
MQSHRPRRARDAVLSLGLGRRRGLVLLGPGCYEQAFSGPDVTPSRLWVFGVRSTNVQRPGGFLR